MHITATLKRQATQIQKQQLQFSPKKIAQMEAEYATICVVIKAALFCLRL